MHRKALLVRLSCVLLGAFGLSALARADEAVAFDRTLRMQGVGFRVQSANSTVPGTLRVVPSGLSADNTVQEREIRGRVTSAVVADLNRDGSPELYVVVRGEAPRAEGSLVAFGANRRKSLSDIAVPALDDTAGAAAGYRGQDRFSVMGATVVRYFPVYRDGQPDGRPSGHRKIVYRLQAGEASWQLVPVRVTDR